MIKLSDDLKYFFSGAFFIGLSSVYSLVVPLMVLPYLIKTVGLSSYGLSIIAFSIAFSLSLVIDLGYNISGVNRLSKSDSNKEKAEIIAKISYTKIVLFLILFVCLTIGIAFTPYLRQHLVLFLCSFLITLSPLFNFNWALQGLQKIKLLGIMNVLNKTIYMAGIFLFINKQKDFVYINFWYAIGIIITGLISLFIINQKIPLKSIPFDYKTFLEEIKTSSYYFVSNISIYMSVSFYPVIIKVFLSNEMVGVYSVVEKIYNLLRTIFSAYINLMLPKISSLVEDSKIIALRVLKQTYLLLLLYLIVQTTLAWVFRNKIILYFTNEYVNLTVGLFETTFLGIFFVIFNTPIYLMLLALDKKKVIMKTTTALAFTGLLLCTILSSFFGIKGAVYSIILIEFSYALCYSITYINLKNNL